MGVVNTTYTFSNTDTITSSKLNNIIDDTTFTGDAISGSSLQIVSPGKLAVAAGGITSNELASSSVTQAKLASNIAGNGPAFRAYASGTTSVPNNSAAKVNLATEDFDTGSYFASSRFTPLVSGYYFIHGSIDFNAAVTSASARIYFNGNQISIGSSSERSSQVSDLIYMNGSTDYVELYAYHNSGTAKTIPISSAGTYLCGYLARSA